MQLFGYKVGPGRRRMGGGRVNLLPGEPLLAATCIMIPKGKRCSSMRDYSTFFNIVLYIGLCGGFYRGMLVDRARGWAEVELGTSIMDRSSRFP